MGNSGAFKTHIWIFFNTEKVIRLQVAIPFGIICVDAADLYFV
jgi:hypothetical protein